MCSFLDNIDLNYTKDIYEYLLILILPCIVIHLNNFSLVYCTRHNDPSTENRVIAKFTVRLQDMQRDFHLMTV